LLLLVGLIAGEAAAQQSHLKELQARRHCWRQHTSKSGNQLIQQQDSATAQGHQQQLQQHSLQYLPFTMQFSCVVIVMF
jgi:hypothetical protein